MMKNKIILFIELLICVCGMYVGLDAIWDMNASKVLEIYALPLSMFIVHRIKKGVSNGN